MGLVLIVVSLDLEAFRLGPDLQGHDLAQDGRPVTASPAQGKEETSMCWMVVVVVQVFECSDKEFWMR